jgi:hypothetical protein
MIGQAVKHNVFGTGVITVIHDSVVTICFGKEEKRFIYPDAFKKHLVFKDLAEQKRMDKMIIKKMQAKEEIRRAAQAERERQRKSENFKIITNSQAVFNLAAQDKKHVFSDWIVSTGKYLSGYSKGQPRVPDRLKPNAACLLTERPKNLPESERRIVGAFMVKDDFFGDECKDGIICAHEKYRVALSEQEFLPFWKYFSESVQPKWGNTAYKYFSNKVMQSILQDMVKTSAPENRKNIEAFDQYFRKINHL